MQHLEKSNWIFSEPHDLAHYFHQPEGYLLYVLI